MVFLLAVLLVSLNVNAQSPAPACTPEEAMDEALEVLRQTSDAASPAECPQARPPRALAALGLDPMAPPPGPPPPKVRGDLKSIDIGQGGKIRKLLYAQYPAKGIAKGTVILLGGGPAAPWIAKGRPPVVPKDYDVIVADYPGIGANARGSILAGTKSSAYSLESAARSIQEIIRQTGLKNYVLYGHSYGTAVATKTAHLIENDPRPMEHPKALILEGTLGRAFRPSDKSGGVHEQDAGHVATSDRAMSLLNREERDQVSRKIAAASGDSAANQLLLANYLQAELSHGAQLTAGLLRSLIKMPADQVLACAKAFAKQGSEKSLIAPLSTENYMKGIVRAACEVIRPQPRSATFALFNGILKGGSSLVDICRCAKSEESGIYDARDLKLKKIPVLYIVGSSDPKTPVWQTDYHRRQIASATSVYSIADGGHSDFFGAAMEPRCYENSFATAFSGGHSGQWTESLKNCRSQLEYSPPQSQDVPPMLLFGPASTVK